MQRRLSFSQVYYHRVNKISYFLLIFPILYKQKLVQPNVVCVNILTRVFLMNRHLNTDHLFELISLKLIFILSILLYDFYKT